MATTREEASKILHVLWVYYHHYLTEKEAEAVDMAIEALKQPERKNGKKFIEIVVEYPAICPYPEYEGKPYFSIRYEENGEKFEGFGTYKPEVLSEYIREYFMGEKKGKWEWDAEEGYWCSECKKYAYGCTAEIMEGSYKFCPFCGSENEENQWAEGKE